MRWRWDQGRLEYFRFDNVVRIAETLAKLDGAPLNVGEDPLRGPLVEHTGLEFKPDHYRVWRNYARVFRCALLATDIGHRLAVTSLCRKLADPSSGVTPDEYLNFVFSRFAQTATRASTSTTVKNSRTGAWRISGLRKWRPTCTASPKGKSSHEKTLP